METWPGLNLCPAHYPVYSLEKFHPIEKSIYIFEAKIKA